MTREKNITLLVFLTVLTALSFGLAQAQSPHFTDNEIETGGLDDSTISSTTNGTPVWEEVIIDFSTVGSGVPFSHDHFKSAGIIFTASHEFIGFIQGDEALTSTDSGLIAADIPQGFSDISVSAAAGWTGSWEFTLTAINSIGAVVDQVSLSFEETGNAGYQVLSLSNLSDAVSFDFWGIKGGNSTLPHSFGINVIKFTPLPSATTDIDIKPGSDPNSINCNNMYGVIPIAILTTDTFDATTVDHTTVSFEGASETHVNKKTGEPIRHVEDVDLDGDMDLVFHFRLGDTALTCESTEGTLTGETYDGMPIEGSDSIRMIDHEGS